MAIPLTCFPGSGVLYLIWAPNVYKFLLTYFRKASAVLLARVQAYNNSSFRLTHKILKSSCIRCHYNTFQPFSTILSFSVVFFLNSMLDLFTTGIICFLTLNEKFIILLQFNATLDIMKYFQSWSHYTPSNTSLITRTESNLEKGLLLLVMFVDQL